MASLWVKLRALLKAECAELRKLLAPLTAELKELAEQDLKDIAQAGITAALASTVSKPLTLTTAEEALVAGGRAVLAAASQKGVQLTVHAALGVAAIAGINTGTQPPQNK